MIAAEGLSVWRLTKRVCGMDEKRNRMGKEKLALKAGAERAPILVARRVRRKPPTPSVLRNRETPRKRQFNSSRSQEGRKMAAKWLIKGLCTHDGSTAKKKKRKCSRRVSQQPRQIPREQHSVLSRKKQAKKKRKRGLKSIFLPSTHISENSLEHAGAGREKHALLCKHNEYTRKRNTDGKLFGYFFPFR